MYERPHDRSVVEWSFRRWQTLPLTASQGRSSVRTRTYTSNWDTETQNNTWLLSRSQDPVTRLDPDADTASSRASATETHWDNLEGPDSQTTRHVCTGSCVACDDIALIVQERNAGDLQAPRKLCLTTYGVSAFLLSAFGALCMTFPAPG